MRSVAKARADAGWKVDSLLVGTGSLRSYNFRAKDEQQKRAQCHCGSPLREMLHLIGFSAQNLVHGELRRNRKEQVI